VAARADPPFSPRTPLQRRLPRSGTVGLVNSLYISFFYLLSLRRTVIPSPSLAFSLFLSRSPFLFLSLSFYFSDAFLAAGQWGWSALSPSFLSCLVLMRVTLRWCAGRKMPGACRGGHNKSSNSDTVTRYRCLTCKFDLCIECFLDASLMPKPLEQVTLTHLHSHTYTHTSTNTCTHTCTHTYTHTHAHTYTHTHAG
jgi:hypothetical protein